MGESRENAKRYFKGLAILGGLDWAWLQPEQAPHLRRKLTADIAHYNDGCGSGWCLDFCGDAIQCRRKSRSDVDALEPRTRELISSPAHPVMRNSCCIMVVSLIWAFLWSNFHDELEKRRVRRGWRQHTLPENRKSQTAIGSAAWIGGAEPAGARWPACLKVNSTW